jgi:hypothetical protein
MMDPAMHGRLSLFMVLCLFCPVLTAAEQQRYALVTGNAA